MLCAARLIEIVPERGFRRENVAALGEQLQAALDGLLGISRRVDERLRRVGIIDDLE
jgi:hypothetical protein